MTDYLLVKRGLYYRPNNAGYTTLKADAGRYSKADERPECGVTAVLASEAGAVAPGGHEIDHLRYERATMLEALEECATDLSIAADNAAHAARTDPRWKGVDAKLRARANDARAIIAKAKGEV